jgi:hypothetical protein|tara:strand:+ start:847 stop:1143 length:297 start_codon:yes stop_codon:yes gene_type:complete
MPSWKKLITSGSNATLSSLSVDNQITGSSLTGSFTGSYSGDASGLTGISIIGSSNPATFTSDFTTTAGTFNSLLGNITVNEGVTFTVTAESFLKIENF